MASAAVEAPADAESVVDDGHHMRFFPLALLQPLHRVLLIGGTTCGKTTALYEFVHAMHSNGKRGKRKRGFQFAQGFSRTETANGNLGGPVVDDDGTMQHKYALMPRYCAHSGYDEDKLAEFMQFQQNCKRLGRMKQSVVIFDDVMSQKGIKNSKVLNEFMQNARNYGCGSAASTHVVKQMSPDARTQYHWVVCYELAEDQMQHFYKVFASRVFKSFKSFQNTWVRLNEKYGKYWALVIDLQGTNGSTLVERVFKYKAADPTAAGFRIPHICDLGFWWIQERMSKTVESASLNQVFDLVAVAQRKGLSMGRRNAHHVAHAAARMAGRAVSVAAAATHLYGGDTVQPVMELMV
jgi:hypothetical protein